MSPSMKCSNVALWPFGFLMVWSMWDIGRRSESRKSNTCVLLFLWLPPSWAVACQVLFYLKHTAPATWSLPTAKALTSLTTDSSPCLFLPGEVKLPLGAKPKVLHHPLFIYHHSFHIVQISLSWICPQLPPSDSISCQEMERTYIWKGASKLTHIHGLSLSWPSTHQGSTQLSREQKFSLEHSACHTPCWLPPNGSVTQSQKWFV